MLTRVAGNSPQFVFNMGGGPGIRVHQFGGGRPQRRPRDPNAPPEPPASLQTTLMGLLPLLFILLLPLLSSLFGGSGEVPGPSMRFDQAVPPHTNHRQTSRFKVDYYTNPAEISGFSPSQLAKLDQKAWINYVTRLNEDCQIEEATRQQLFNEAQGWFFQDEEKMQQVKKMEMRSCNRLKELGEARNQNYLGQAFVSFVVHCCVLEKHGVWDCSIFGRVYE